MVQTYTFKGQEVKKNVYRPASAHALDSASKSNISPIGIPHILRHRKINKIGIEQDLGALTVVAFGGDAQYQPEEASTVNECQRADSSERETCIDGPLR